MLQKDSINKMLDCSNKEAMKIVDKRELNNTLNDLESIMMSNSLSLGLEFIWVYQFVGKTSHIV